MNLVFDVGIVMTAMRYFKTDVKEREHLGQRMLPKHEIPPVGEKRQVFLPAHS